MLLPKVATHVFIEPFNVHNALHILILLFPNNELPNVSRYIAVTPSIYCDLVALIDANDVCLGT